MLLVLHAACQLVYFSKGRLTAGHTLLAHLFVLDCEFIVTIACVESGYVAVWMLHHEFSQLYSFIL